MATINSLPNDLIKEVINQSGNLQAFQTCKRWYAFIPDFEILATNLKRREISQQSYTNFKDLFSPLSQELSAEDFKLAWTVQDPPKEIIRLIEIKKMDLPLIDKFKLCSDIFLIKELYRKISLFYYNEIDLKKDMAEIFNKYNQSNDFESIRFFVTELQKLLEKKEQLAHLNFLKTIAKSFKDDDDIKELIKTLDEEGENLRKESIFLLENSLKQKDLSQIQVLEFEGHIPYLPEISFNLSNLKKFTLSKCNLISVPSGIEKLITLEVLVFNNNYITSLPEELKSLTNLKALRLDSNAMTSIPKVIYELKSLQLIDLRSNPLDISEFDVKELICSINNVRLNAFLFRNKVPYSSQCWIDKEYSDETQLAIEKFALIKKSQGLQEEIDDKKATIERQALLLKQNSEFYESSLKDKDIKISKLRQQLYEQTILNVYQKRKDAFIEAAEKVEIPDKEIVHWAKKSAGAEFWARVKQSYSTKIDLASIEKNFPLPEENSKNEM